MQYSGNTVTGDDEIFERMVSVEELTIVGNFDVMMDDDAEAAGIATVNVSGTNIIRTASDYDIATLTVNAAAINTAFIDYQ